MVGRCTSYAAGRDLTSGLWKFERSAPSRTCSSLASGLAQNTKRLLIATSWPPPRPGQFFGKQSNWYSVLSIIPYSLLSPFCCCYKTAAQDKDLNEEPSSKVSCCVEVFVICLSHPLILSMPFHFPTGTMHACLSKNRFSATSCDDDCCGGTAAVWQLEGRFLLLHCLDVCTNTFTNSFSHLFPLQVQWLNQEYFLAPTGSDWMCFCGNSVLVVPSRTHWKRTISWSSQG